MSSLLVTIVAGDTVAAGDHKVTLYERNTVVDLTGCTVNWRARHKQSSTSVVSAASVISPATGGTVSPVYTATESALLTAGRYAVQIEVVDGSGGKRTFPSPEQPQIEMLVEERL